MMATIANRKLRIIIMFMLAGVAFGLMYPILGREFFDPVAVLNGLTIGIVGSLFLSVSELYISNPLKRKMKFIPQVLLKTGYYTTFFVLLILLVYSVNRSIFSQKGYVEYLRSSEFSAFIILGDFNIIVGYTLLISAAIIFTHQMSLKMGQGVLLNLIFGKYYHPTREERVFMFLDLNDSTGLAEKLGEVKYNQLVNEFFQDITDPIVNSNGLIYRYVGDEVVVTWKVDMAIKDINCLRAYFNSIDVINSRREKYLTKYGVLPQFCAGFHIGSVVIGQVGDVKSQIVFSGPVLYEGGIIEKSCRIAGHNHLISESLMDQLILPRFFTKKHACDAETESSGTIRLYTVTTLDKA